ncbi:MAG TPA: hypothetical protein VFF52_12640 [Isosphaeraceae bacterium]|nr:hypothetical protein [Isosphaeraceae bacterium]
MMPKLVTTLALTVALAGALPGNEPGSEPSPSSAPGWRFVLPAPGDAFEHAPFRALVLSREKPEDLIEKAGYRGNPARRRYAQVRFGSPGSIRVAVVLDEVGPGEVDLYVDADRNRRIDDRDRAAAAGAETGSRRERIWRLPLDVAMIDGEVTHTVPRAVVFRLGTSGRTLGYAAAGYLEGTITLGGDPAESSRSPVRRLAARRVDGDGNGLVSDGQDRLWIDLNGDGCFDPAAEQFLFANVLNLGGSRYVVRSDELGSRLVLSPLVGVGTLRLASRGNHSVSAGGPAELHATVLGRDGSVFGLAGGDPATVPVGEYRLGTVTVAFDDPQGGPRWSFVFSDNGAKGAPRWYKIEKNRSVTIDPIGTPSFELSLSDNAAPRVKRGEDLDVQPWLYTGDGLLINVAYRGAPVSPASQETLGAHIALQTTSGHTLATAHSGFA